MELLVEIGHVVGDQADADVLAVRAEEGELLHVVSGFNGCSEHGKAISAIDVSCGKARKLYPSPFLFWVPLRPLYLSISD